MSFSLFIVWSLPVIRASHDLCAFSSSDLRPVIVWMFASYTDLAAVDSALTRSIRICWTFPTPTPAMIMPINNGMPYLINVQYGNIRPSLKDF